MRYTRAFLEHQVGVINAMLGHDRHSVTTETPGSVHLYSAYGGYGVHYVGVSGRGRDALLPCHPARETARYLAGMISALEIAGGRR